MTKLSRLLGFTSLLALGACASTRIFPKENGEATIVANSSSQSAAYDAALEDGRKHCEQQGLKFVMVRERSDYQGMDKNAKAVIGVLGAMTNKPTYGHTNGHDDNKVTIDFKCVR